MAKFYTKSGDDGSTSIGNNGKRVKKYSDIIELYGTIDELNVFLGYAAESLCHNQDQTEFLKKIYSIQREIFELGTHLSSGKKFAVNPHKITKLEFEIDEMSEKLPIVRSFILPGGGELALRFHMARVVCRRAERVAFKLADTMGDVEIIAVYLNRLSDWLYAAARTAAMLVNAEEILVND
jgi:cob(I)alamin adenosyltransferase